MPHPDQVKHHPKAKATMKERNVLLVCDGVIPRLPLETGNGKILHAERRGEQWRLGLA